MDHNIITTALAIGGIHVFVLWMMGGPMPSDIIKFVKFFKSEGDERNYHLRYFADLAKVSALRSSMRKAKA